MADCSVRKLDVQAAAILLSRALGGSVDLAAFDAQGRPLEPAHGEAPYRAPDFALSPALALDLAEGRRAELSAGGRRYWALGTRDAQGLLWLAIQPAGNGLALPRFAEHLVHALRNGLASVKLAAQSMSRAENLNDRQHRQLAVSLREVSRMERTLSTASEFSRAPTRSTAEVDPVALLRSAAATMQAELDARGVTLARHLEPVGMLRSDTHRLQLTLENLIGFGARATPRGGVLEVSLARRDQAVVLVVRDRGDGLTEADRQSLMLPLASGPRANGLDLALAAQVAAELGGAIEVKNADPGVELTLWLGRREGGTHGHALAGG